MSFKNDISWSGPRKIKGKLRLSPRNTKKHNNNKLERKKPRCNEKTLVSGRFCDDHIKNRCCSSCVGDPVKNSWEFAYYSDQDLGQNFIEIQITTEEIKYIDKLTRVVYRTKRNPEFKEPRYDTNYCEFDDSW